MTSVLDRFLKYVTFDTQSDEYSETCPSTDKQKCLGAALVEEMKAMGIEDARMDEHGYVYGTVPGDPNLPTIGLIAHMDTSPDASGANVKARVVEYDGTDILLGEESVSGSCLRFLPVLFGLVYLGGCLRAVGIGRWHPGNIFSLDGKEGRRHG